MEKMAAIKDTGPKKMPTQEVFVKLTNEKTRKGKRKATIKDTRFGYLSNHIKVGFTMGDWIECHCKQWIHKDCIIGLCNNGKSYNYLNKS